MRTARRWYQRAQHFVGTSNWTTAATTNNTGLFEMTVWVLTTCHTQYTWVGVYVIFI